MSLVPDSRSGEASGPAGFLGLPLGIRKDIYKRVLVVGHPIYLFQDSGSRVETFAPDKPRRWLALLYTNRQIYDEAKAVLYGQNYFCLIDKPQQQDALLRSFLICIGSPNASSLSRLCISFPVVEKAQNQQEDIRVREDSLRGLRLLQEKCSNLKTLELQVSSENSKFLTGAGLGNPQFVQEALVRIDAELKNISSVEKIIIRLYVKDVPSQSVDIIKGFGWVVLDR